MTDSIDALLDTTASAPADQDSAPEPTQPKKARRRRSASPRPTEPLYSMAQVAQIMDFTSEFDDTNEANRRTFFAVFGWPSDTDADGLKVAQALNDNPADIRAFGLLQEIVTLISTGGLGFKETIALVGRFSALDPDVLAAFATAVNGITNAETPIEYNKRTEIADLLSDTVDYITTATASDFDKGRVNEVITWIDELVTTWPGK